MHVYVFDRPSTQPFSSVSELLLDLMSSFSLSPSHPTVPSPTLTITGSPLDDGFHTGLVLTFTGRVEFHPDVNSPLNVDAVWSRTGPSSDLIADMRVSIGQAVMVGTDPMVFESNLTINTLDRDRNDSGTYNFFVNVTSSEAPVVGTTTSTERTITVLGKSWRRL